MTWAAEHDVSALIRVLGVFVMGLSKLNDTPRSALVSVATIPFSSALLIRRLAISQSSPTDF